MKMKAKKTPYRLAKEEKDFQIFTDWNAEMAKPGAMATAVDRHIMAKYKIFSASNIWTIRKRVEKRLAVEATLNTTAQ